jgi:hypothetical protein
MQLLHVDEANHARVRSRLEKGRRFMHKIRLGLIAASMMYIAVVNAEEATPLPTPEAKKAQAEYLSDLSPNSKPW